MPAQLFSKPTPRSLPAHGLGGIAVTPGTQALVRSLSILELVTKQAGHEGVRLIDVVSGSGLHKATVHRILSALDAQGFIQQDPETRRYRPGFKVMAMAEHVAANSALLRCAELPCARLSLATSDTVFLSVRQGLDSLCIKRHEGDFPIRTLTLDVGSTRPLGIGAGSLALLSALPQFEVQEVIRGNRERLLEHYPQFTEARLQHLVQETQDRGYAFNDEGLIPGMSAVGVPVLMPGGHPIAALSVAAISDRMAPARREAIASQLKAESRELATKFSSQGS